MKKQLLSILTAGCLMAAMVPAAFAADTSMSEEAFRDAVASGTVNMTGDVTLTSTVRVESGVTINGNGFSVNGSVSDGLICIDTNEDVTINGLDINGAVGIDVVSESPNISIYSSEINASSRGIRFYDEDTEDNELAVFSGFTLTLDNTTIQNTLKPADKTYENWSHQGDSRGISLWNMEGSIINIDNGSKILGFGYPINMAGDKYTNGVLDTMDSTINVTNSDIWGWCAMNIWTIDTTFNIKSSHLKGFVETDNAWNSFATIVLNEGIYGDMTPDDEANNDKANVFNIAGGSVTSNSVSNDAQVYHCLFRLDKEFMSEFNFARANRQKVALTCADPFSAFLITYDGMEIPDFENWAETKLTGAAENTTYNWGAIAPGVDAPIPGVLSIQSVDTVTLDGGMGHEGGLSQ